MYIIDRISLLWAKNSLKRPRVYSTTLLKFIHSLIHPLSLPFWIPHVIVPTSSPQVHLCSLVIVLFSLAVLTDDHSKSEIVETGFHPRNTNKVNRNRRFVMVRAPGWVSEGRPIRVKRDFLALAASSRAGSARGPVDRLVLHTHTHTYRHSFPLISLPVVSDSLSHTHRARERERERETARMHL